MLKRKRNPTKKKPTPKKKGKPEPTQIIFKSLKTNELPSEIWERIASKLDPRSLVKWACLGPADHWLCFYVGEALKKKKLTIICHALHYLYNYGDLVPRESKTEPGPSSALDLLDCFSNGASVTVLPNLIANVLQTYVRYFTQNKREATQNCLDIYGLVPYDNCCMGSTPQGFYISVRIRLINHFPLAWKFYAKQRFCPQDYIIRICQIKNKESKLHPFPRILFAFFKHFKFNLRMYDSTDWILGKMPKHYGARVIWP